MPRPRFTGNITIRADAPALEDGVDRRLVLEYVNFFKIRSKGGQSKLIRTFNVIYATKDGKIQHIDSPRSLKGVVNFFVENELIAPDRVNFMKAVSSKFVLQLQHVSRFNTLPPPAEAAYQSKKQRLSEESRQHAAGTPEARRNRRRQAENTQDNKTAKEKKVAQNTTTLSRAVLSFWLGILTDTKTN